MRPTLFYIPPELFGIELFGFGLLFWIIFAATLGALIWALAVKKSREDFWSSLLLGGVASVLVVWIAPAVGEGKGFPIRGYGVFLMLAILLAATVVFWLGKKRARMAPDALIPIIIVQVVCGILGARLFYLAEYWDSVRAETFAQTFLNAVNLTRGGLVVFGSILGGMIASGIYLYRKKIPVLATLDIFAPALMLGIAIGRLGCFMNGCCFGAVCDCPLGVTFPVASPAHFCQMENGDVPLGCFTLEEPNRPDSAASTLFHLKKTAPRLRSAVPGPVKIASVVPESEADRAGLLPGMTVLRVGLIPESAQRPTESEIEHATTFPVRCNDDMFRFMLYESGALTQSPTILFDVEPLDGSNASDDSDRSDASARFERLAFRTGPFPVRPVHPTQLYSSALTLGLFFVLLIAEPRCRKSGVMFSLTLILYSLVRFGVETIRTDETSFFGTGLSVSQCVSIGVLIFAVVCMIYVLTRKTSDSTPDNDSDCGSDNDSNNSPDVLKDQRCRTP